MYKTLVFLTIESFNHKSARTFMQSNMRQVLKNLPMVPVRV